MSRWRRFWAWVGSRPIRAWIVLVWLLGWLALAVGLRTWMGWGLFMLFVPLYWHVLLKRDLAPSLTED